MTAATNRAVAARVAASGERGTSALRKLLSCSFDELRVRTFQRLAIMIERSEAATGTDPLGEAAVLRGLRPRCADADALLKIFRSHAHTAPIPGLRDIAATAAAVPPAERARAIAAAEAVLHGHIPLFGGQVLDYGTPIDWHREPRTGCVPPLAHWSRIDYLDPAIAGDKKLVWEINRQQYLLTLARAYAATRDERYATAFVSHVEAWIASNPPRVGINWASSLEVAIRAITWIWALLMFRHSAAVTAPFLLAVTRQLELSGRHIERHLSTYFSPNTHLTGEALALFYLGAVLPFLSSAERWRQTGHRILVDQIDKQVLADGLYFENATYYHRYALDIFVHFAVLAEASGQPLGTGSLRRIEALADAIAALIRPDGTHGFLGDDDGGRLLPLDASAPNDFRSALSTAAVVLGRSDLARTAGSLAEETLWLLGATAQQSLVNSESLAPVSLSRAMPNGGLFVMRDGHGPSANHLIIDCGPHGAMNCGHAHADALAFELVAAGRPILLDPGTFTYTGDPAARNKFRSTAYHNALTVDDMSSSEPAGPFSWRSIAECRLLHWSSNQRFDAFVGEHTGFERLADPVKYWRSVLFVKGGYWIMVDSLRSAAAHAYTQHFHYASDASPRVVAHPHYCTERAPDRPGLDVISFADGGRWQLESGWISSCYGDRSPAAVATFTINRASACDITTYLLPRANGSDGPLPEERTAGAGREFRLPGIGGLVDIFATAGARTGPSRILTTEWDGDAEWLWCRSSSAGIDSVVAYDVTRLDHNGVAVLRAPAPLRLALWRDGDRLLVDATGRAGETFEIAPFGCTRMVCNGQEIDANGLAMVDLRAKQPQAPIRL